MKTLRWRLLEDVSMEVWRQDSLASDILRDIDVVFEGGVWYNKPETFWEFATRGAVSESFPVKARSTRLDGYGNPSSLEFEYSGSTFSTSDLSIMKKIAELGGEVVNIPAPQVERWRVRVPGRHVLAWLASYDANANYAGDKYFASHSSGTWLYMRLGAADSLIEFAHKNRDNSVPLTQAEQSFGIIA